MSFTAYLAPDRQRALAQNHAMPERAFGAALFADISGFTRLTEALARELGPHRGAEELTRHLNVVYEALITIIEQHGGSVISFSGDAVTCWFDAPSEDAGVVIGQRTAACGLALQRAMAELADIHTPAGQRFILVLKVAISVGPARRFLVGDPAIQQLDVLAGAMLLRLAAAEHCAEPGEIVADAATAALLTDVVVLAEWRRDEHGIPQAAVIARRIVADDGTVPEAVRAENETLTLDQVRPFLLPAIGERLSGGFGDPPTELRPAVALFLRFATLDYDHDADAGAQLDAYICWIQSVLAHYGGTMLQLSIGDKGSYLYAAFGAPAAHENDPERALRAALDLQTPPPELASFGTPQIGVARGTMRTGAYGGSGRLTYGVLGDPVNMAARLMQAAPDGQTLVGATVQQACADSFAWEELPPLPVKGKAEPLRVFRMLAAQEQGAPAFYQGVLVGRAAELERLLDAAAPILAGQFAGVCYVDGEAGIGKSRLVYEARQQIAERTPLIWMYCPSDDVLRGSLRPFATFLQNYFHQSIQHDEAENKARFADVLDGLIGELGERRTTNDERRTNESGQPAADAGQPARDYAQLAAELDRTRSFMGALVGLRWDGSLYEQLEPKLRFENTLSAFATLVKTESLRGPVWLELEDAHWLDDDSQTVVTNLSRALAGFPVVIVCAARPDDEGRPARLALAEDTPICVVDLAALSLDGTRTYAEQVLAQPVGDELAAFVYERTGGNPFFVEQLLLDLRERGLIENKEQGTKNKEPEHKHRFSAEVPDTLNSLLVARLDRLAEPVREVVQTAAVLGREWALPVLAAMRHDDDDLPPSVRAAEDGRVWSPLSEHDYLFRHVLLRDAAYGMQARERLRALHWRAIDSIEQEYAENLAPQYAALVYHAHEAEDRERERRYATLAGESAAVRYANAEAITFLSRALELTAEDDLEERWEILVAREQVYDLQGDSHQRAHDLATLAILADNIDDDALRAEVSVRRARYAEVISDFKMVIVAANHAVTLAEKLGITSIVMRAYRQWGWSLQRQGQYDAARDMAERSLECARSIGDQQGQAQAFYDIGAVAMYRGDFTTAETAFNQGLRIAREAGDRRFEGVLLRAFGVISRELRDYTVQSALCNQYLRLAREIGDRRAEAVAMLWRGVLCLDLGNYGDAKVAYEQALEIFRASADQYMECSLLINLAQIAHLSGDNATAKSQAQAAIQLAETMGIEHLQSHALTFFGHAQAAFGQLDQAAEAYARAYEQRRRNGEHTLMLEAQVFLAHVALLQGDLVNALAQITPFLERLIAGDTLDAMEERMRDYLIVYRVLSAVQDSRAVIILTLSQTFLQERTAKIPDEAARRMFLENVPHHRELVAAWQAAQSRAAGATAEAGAAPRLD